MTFADQAEAAARELLAEPPPPPKPRTRYRARIRDGRFQGTLWIDAYGTINFRPLHKRRVYAAEVAKVAALFVQRLAMAEGAKARAKRSPRRHARLTGKAARRRGR